LVNIYVLWFLTNYTVATAVGRALAEVDSVIPVPRIAGVLKALGVVKLMPPQVEAVRRGLLSRDSNLVVVSPTGSGKSLIGYIAILRSLLKGLKGVYLVPLKSIAGEKFEELDTLCREVGCRVCITTGDYDQPSEWLSACDVIVATYERFDSLLRLKPSWVGRVDTVVIDEVHNVGDPERGHVVELIVARALRRGFRVVGLGATVGNPEELAEWLNAELVYSTWRPVRLIEGYYSSRRGAIVFEDGREEAVAEGLEVHLLRKAFEENYQVLVFRHSRQYAEGLARQLASVSRERCDDLVEELLDIEIPRVEVDSLRYVVSRCVAYHHAGLSLGARKFIERSFRGRKLRAVTATPTLAAGVNLPARRVAVSIRRYEEGYVKTLSIAEYKQMAGRAGRPGLDPYGEVVISDARSSEEALRYIRSPPEPVTSVLRSERALRIHTLSLIASGEATDLDSLIELLKLTLAYRQLGEQLVKDVERTLRLLEGMGMVLAGGALKPTKLGKNVTSLYVDPLTAWIVLEQLRGRPGKGLYDIYYLTLVALTPDFPRVRLGRLRSRELHSTLEVLEEEGQIPLPAWVDEYDLLRALKVGLILRDWIEEVGEDTIAERYGVGVGDLAVIVDSAQWLLYASGVLCGVEGLADHARKLATLSRRVEAGVREDALELVQVRWIGRARARKLIASGIKTLEDLANSSPERVAEICGMGVRQAKEAIEHARELLSKTRGTIHS
jgi:helicase